MGQGKQKNIVYSSDFLVGTVQTLIRIIISKNEQELRVKNLVSLIQNLASSKNSTALKLYHCTVAYTILLKKPNSPKVVSI